MNVDEAVTWCLGWSGMNPELPRPRLESFGGRPTAIWDCRDRPGVANLVVESLPALWRLQPNMWLTAELDGLALEVRGFEEHALEIPHIHVPTGDERREIFLAVGDTLTMRGDVEIL